MKKISAILILLALTLSLLSCSARDREPSPSGAGIPMGGGTANTGEAPGTDSAVPATEPTPSEMSGWATVSGSAAGGDLTYTRPDGTKITDFSFLDDKSRDFLPDAGDPDNGSWYCGKTDRDPETDAVTVVFDRSAETLALLAKYGVIYRGDESRKVCYFTFDCGYENGYTGAILDVLKEKDVKGTFFLNGAYIESSPDLVKRMVDEGHVVGNHGRNHENMSRVDAETFLSEVESNNDLLKASVPGAKYMSCYRPPYGTVTEWDMALAQEMGLRTVLYSWTYYDYNPDEQAAPADALSQAERGLHDGCVYMFHTVGSTNAAIIGDLIDFIRAEGYAIELIG